MEIIKNKNVKGSRIDVKIYRDGLSAPWGFRLHGGVDFDSPLVVQKVTPLSASSEYLKKGDIITQIDGYDVSCLTHNAALNLISNAGSSINFTLLRPEYYQGINNNNYCAVNDLRVHFSDELGFQDKRYQRSHESPAPRSSLGKTTMMTSPASSHHQNLIQRNDEEEEKRHANEQAKKLAGIMKASLQNKEENKTTNKYRKTSDPIKPNIDITSYLPRVPKRCFPSKTSSAVTSPPADIRHQLKDTLLHGCSPCLSSGRNTPSTSSAIELGSPGDRNRPMGVWVPPTHQPQAKLVHLQYNSPMGLYSAHNVADSVEKMTGSKVEWLNKPPSTKYLDDIRESATYKFVQELEGRRPTVSQGKIFEQSTTLKNMSRFFGLDSQ